VLYICREGKGKKNDDDDIDWGTLKPGTALPWEPHYNNNNNNNNNNNYNNNNNNNNNNKIFILQR